MKNPLLQAQYYETYYFASVINNILGDPSPYLRNVDAELVLHTMIEFPNFHKAIIVSGDGDFSCLIEYLITQNKLARILIPNKFSYSSLLRKYSRFMAYVSDLQAKLEYRKKVK
jgi:hypothetical protein